VVLRLVRVVGRVVRRALLVPTVWVTALCLFAGLPLAVVLAPDVEVSVAGQYLSVGARVPTWSLAGPAQVVQIGNTEYDVTPVRVYGPLRPRLSLGPVDRDAAVRAIGEDGVQDTRTTAVSTISNAFLRWYGTATLILIGLTLAALAVAASARLGLAVRRLGTTPDNVGEIWHGMSRRLRRMSLVAVAVTLTGWVASGGFAYVATERGLRDVSSLSDLVGSYHLSPSAVGPVRKGYDGVVIGDSRAARLGGPQSSEATQDDKDCARSTDSLAAEVGSLTGTQVLNLACSGASIGAGLRGPQGVADRFLPPQVGLLKQVQDVKYVVVVIGPNDLYWADFLRYCYGVTSCVDRLTQGEFDYRLAAFDRDYGELLRDLEALPSRPRVVIMGSYDVFAPDATCDDARGPAEAQGLTAQKIDLLINMNQRLNAVLRYGADQYGYSVAEPRIAPLCSAPDSTLGADLQGLKDSAPFHPTAVGEVRMASAVAQALAAEPPQRETGG
jgi:lysophospholipase L1-like esterase